MHGTLHEVTVSGKRVRSYLNSIDGADVVSMEMLQEMPKILGNADPMRYIQTLPGVQTASEYDAGLHIQGSDNTHNQTGIEGVPLYNVAHLLGFFSVFNPTHFADMRLTKSNTAADGPNRLGGTVDMHHADSLHTATGGDIAVGPMSSQGTLRLPTGSRSALTLSARAAYLNLLYSQWLTIDDNKMRYFFSDYNMTYTFRPDSRNTLRADFYHGGDNVGLDESVYDISTSLKWHNTMGALHWMHDGGKTALRQSVYYTAYGNRFALDYPKLSVRLRSDIGDVGYRGRLSMGHTDIGADIAYHAIQPQYPATSGTMNRYDSHVPKQHATEAALYAMRHLPMGRRVTATIGLRASVFHNDGSTFAGADPSLSVAIQATERSSLTLSAGIRHQYLFKTGFSDVGLPTEFWMAADGRNKPQYSYETALRYEALTAGNAWRVTAEAYHKRLFHQIEFDGNVFDLIYTDYNPDNMMMHGKGYNYGMSILVERRKGRLTGWISYSYGRAWRRFPGTGRDGRYPASHERPHEANAVATYRLNRRWSFGGTFVVASGKPYTRAERFYLLSSNIITEFGPYNGERVPAYMRLDLSANYDFKCRKGRRSGINLSVYNATKHSNPMFYRLKIYKERFAYKPFNFILGIMPSVSYYYSF